MRIKYEKNVDYLKSHGVILMGKIGDEESRSKVYLEEKLKLEQELLDMKEDLEKDLATKAKNREELIKLKVKKSQLESQNKQLISDEASFKEKNTKLDEKNKELDKKNLKLKKDIQDAIQKIEINDLLKEIDVEEIQLLAQNNKTMNNAMTNLITKWNVITQKDMGNADDDPEEKK